MTDAREAPSPAALPETREHRAVISADGARADDREAHQNLRRDTAPIDGTTTNTLS